MKSGFTLFELLVVMVIMAILSTMSYRSYQHWLQWNRLQTNADRILQAVQLTRRLALTKKITASCEFNQREIVIHDDMDNRHIILQGKPVKLSWIGSGSRSHAKPILAFDMDGSTRGQQGSVRLCMRGLSNGKRIVVNHAGRAYIADLAC